MSASNLPTSGHSLNDIKETGPDPIDSIYLQQVSRKLWRILDSLNEMERKVLEMRFGLVNDGEMTVDEVADQMGLPPERNRQLESKAQRILRHPECSHKLRTHLG
ncbi:MAG: sigma factor-like helix-turn-helix DNA-binding protein [Desulfobacterales bacterium]|jgi:RNA polymerase primary sigma factor